MNVQIEKNPNGVIVKLDGEIAMANSPELDKALKALTGQKSPSIIIDLSSVTYMDSSGIATLVECLRMSSQYQGRVALAQLHEKIKPIFDLLRLEKVFKIYLTVDEALKG